MVGFVKLCAASAVLTYGVVALSHAVPAVQAGPEKPFQDRIAPSNAPAVKAAEAIRTPAPVEAAAVPGKGDRLLASSCETQTWPYISPDCATRADGAAQPKRVRVITIESRNGNTSVLTRIPQTDLAQR